MLVNCAHCGKETEKEKWRVEKAKSSNLGLYCSLQCAGASKKKNLSIEEKRKAKEEYDRKRRSDKSDLIRAKKAEYYARTKDREKELEVRKKRMPAHVEYCRKPEYKLYKKSYDREYRAKKLYGEFWESALIILDIESLYDQKEIREINNLHNKTQKRKKLWLQLKKKVSLLST